MGGTAYEGINVFCGVQVEVYVDSMDDLVSDYTVDHLLLEFASAVVLIRVADPCGMPRYVAILTTTQQNDLLEIVKMPGLAKFEEEGIFE